MHYPPINGFFSFELVFNAVVNMLFAFFPSLHSSLKQFTCLLEVLVKFLTALWHLDSFKFQIAFKSIAINHQAALFRVPLNIRSKES